jgi:hypothetical protein
MTSIGTWVLGTSGLNLEVIPFEQRADKARWPDGPLYRVKEIFSTRNGSWEVSAEFGSIDGWARDEWWQGAKIDGAGGDHHFFIIVLDAAGKPLPGKGIIWRQGELTADWTPTAQKDAKPDGSENIPMQNSYAPDRGEHGSWSGTTIGRADLLHGADLPWNNHVSVFFVLQASAEPAPEPEPEPEPGGYTALLTRIAAADERIAAAFEYLNARIWSGNP